MKRLLVTTVALLMINAVAYANGGGHEGGHPGDGPGGNAIVAADGTIFVTSTATDSTTITAVTPAGARAWTATVAGRPHLELSGANLLYVTSTTATDGTVSSTINAISTLSGAAAWSRAIAGRVSELTPFSGGTYAFVSTSTTRSLVAISNSGAVLWTLAL